MAILDQLTTLLDHPNAASLKAVLDAAQPDDLDWFLEFGIENFLPSEPSFEQTAWASHIVREVYARVDEISGSSTSGQLLDPRADEAREIGWAFASGLRWAVHDSVEQLSGYFGALGERSEPSWWTDLDDISVEAAGETGAILRRVGMSPLTVAVSAHGIANEFRRTRELRSLPEGQPLKVVVEPEPRARWQSTEPRSPVVTAEDLGRHVSFVASLDREHGQLLGRWLLRAAHQRPLLFDGFDCKGDGETLFCYLTQHVDPLPVRWWSK